MTRIEYIPPPDHVIDRYAFDVCTRLGEDFMDEEIITGLAQFLKVLASISAKQATRLHLTTGAEPGKLCVVTERTSEC